MERKRWRIVYMDNLYWGKEHPLAWMSYLLKKYEKQVKSSTWTSGGLCGRIQNINCIYYFKQLRWRSKGLPMMLHPFWNWALILIPVHLKGLQFQISSIQMTFSFYNFKDLSDGTKCIFQFVSWNYSFLFLCPCKLCSFFSFSSG